MSGTKERLKALGIELPAGPAPIANYVPYVVTGNLVFVSGQGTFKDGKLQYIGKLGREFGIEEGQQAARLCAINVLAQLAKACGGDLDRVTRVVKLGGFVNSTPDFTAQPKVLNGASDLFVAVFGEFGRHARFAVGAPSLPDDIAVEVDGVFEIRA
jgi:enamine deaminase RidA (YjgF/YER057c/UK114 family)